MIRADLPRWPHQRYAFEEVTRRIGAGEKRICLTSPTGAGKSLILCDLIDWATGQGWGTILYTNRRLLIEQLIGTATDAGIAHGVRAAGHVPKLDRQVQIASIQTEHSRTVKREKWNLASAQLVLIDEAHLQKGAMAEELARRHEDAGAALVGVTATPLDLNGMYTTLVQAGTVSELRRCGALVPCHHYGPDEPDMKNFKPKTKTGEYTEGDVRKAIMTPTIFGRVYEGWLRFNPDARPSILFAPGVGESIWFAEQFHAKGVRTAHIDGANCWLDGRQYKSDSDARKDIIAGSKDGSIKVVCNRFVLREGIDMPWLYHGIFATVFASLQSFLQSGGRLLRAHSSLDHVVLQDHGGMWHRHGSLNADRTWELGQTAYVTSALREERMRSKREPEPIRCPACFRFRLSGDECPHCGHRHSTKSRMVVQQDGELREHTGDIYKPRRVRLKPDTERIWESMYWRAKRSRNGMTFRQAQGLFFYENGYYPPNDLPMMPTSDLDWFRRVKDVPMERLTHGNCEAFA